MSKICGVILNLRQSAGKLAHGIHHLHPKICLALQRKREREIEKFLPGYKKSSDFFNLNGASFSTKSYEAIWDISSCFHIWLIFFAALVHTWKNCSEQADAVTRTLREVMTDMDESTCKCMSEKIQSVFSDWGNKQQNDIIRNSCFTNSQVGKCSRGGRTTRQLHKHWAHKKRKVRPC